MRDVDAKKIALAVEGGALQKRRDPPAGVLLAGPLRSRQLRILAKLIRNSRENFSFDYFGLDQHILAGYFRCLSPMAIT